MTTPPESIIERFERGDLSRRQLVAQLMALGAAAAAGAAGGFPRVARAQATAAAPASQPAATFIATGIDHLALSVTDVKRSTAFYEQHLGLRHVRGSGDGSAFLTSSGTDFLALFRGETPGLHHFSFSIPKFDANDAARRIERAGLTPRRSDNRVYFLDPDKLTIQVHAGRGITP